jgi:uncharacterized protein
MDAAVVMAGNLAAMMVPIALLGAPMHGPSSIQQRPTYDDLRFTGMHRQNAEPSCATASIATIVQLQFGVVLDEAQLWMEHLSQLDPERQRETLQNGLSLTDIARLLDRRGYAALAVRIGLVDLARIRRPAIVHLERGGIMSYRHFAVFKGLQGTDVILLDPALGKRRVHISEFRRYWNGVAVFVNKS